MDTKETIKANVARFTTANVTCTLSDETNYPNYILKHKDFPFECVIVHFTIDSKKTGRIFISSDSDKDVRAQFGLSYDLFKSAQGYAESEVKYSKEKPEEPTCTLLSKVEGKRLEQFYTNWFSYLNETKYLPLVRHCEKIVVLSNESRTYADKVLSLTTETTEKSTYGKDNIILLKNKFAEMEISESYKSVRVKIEDYYMTENQRERLFIFLDEMSKEPK